MFVFCMQFSISISKRVYYYFEKFRFSLLIMVLLLLKQMLIYRFHRECNNNKKKKHRIANMQWVQQARAGKHVSVIPSDHFFCVCIMTSCRMQKEKIETRMHNALDNWCGSVVCRLSVCGWKTDAISWYLYHCILYTTTHNCIPKKERKKEKNWRHHWWQ